MTTADFVPPFSRPFDKRRSVGATVLGASKLCAEPRNARARPKRGSVNGPPAPIPGARRLPGARRGRRIDVDELRRMLRRTDSDGDARVRQTSRHRIRSEGSSREPARAIDAASEGPREPLRGLQRLRARRETHRRSPRTHGSAHRMARWNAATPCPRSTRHGRTLRHGGEETELQREGGRPHLLAADRFDTRARRPSFSSRNRPRSFREDHTVRSPWGRSYWA